MKFFLFYFFDYFFNAIFVSKSKVFNVPYRLVIGNDKLNEILDFEIVSKKLVLKIENETDYKMENNTGSLKMSFKNKSNTFNYQMIGRAHV